MTPEFSEGLADTFAWLRAFCEGLVGLSVDIRPMVRL
jgi:hypothetical protein